MSRPFLFLLAAAFPLLLYARTTTFDFVRADDLDLIAGNQSFLADLRNVPRAFTRSYFEVEGDLVGDKTYYRPAAIVSFMLDAARSGADPRTYHLTNIVLHAAVTVLLLQLAFVWGARPMAALGAALVFAAHPVNVQAVAWIAGRNDLLLATFGLMSLLAFAALKARATTADAARRFGAAILHVFAFALALFSKEIGLFFPLLGVLHQVIVVRASLSRAQRIVLGLDAVVVALWAILRAQALAGMPSELSAATLRTAVLNAPQLLVHAGKMLVPVHLNVAPGVEWSTVTLGAAAVVVVAWVTWKFVPRALTIVAVAWVLAFLLPTLVVPGLPVYEHRAYVPLLGLLLMFATAVPSRINRKAGIRAGFSRPILVLAILTTFAIFTSQRQQVFRNPFTYWTDATRDEQFGPLAHVNLGQLHEGEGRLTEARREYVRALERDPGTPKAHNNLGVVLMKMDRPDQALTQFREEARRHPWNADAWYNLGLFEEMRGNETTARRHYERAIAENRAYLPAYEKLGIPMPVSPKREREGGPQRP